MYLHVPAPPPFANSLARLRSRSALVGLGGGTGFKATILRWCVERSLLAPKTTDRPPPLPPAKWLMLRADDRSRPPPPPPTKAAAAPSSRVIELALPGDRRDELDDPGRLQGVRSRGDTIVGIRSVFRLAAFRSALPSPPSKHTYVTHVQTRCTVTSRTNHQVGVIINQISGVANGLFVYILYNIIRLAYLCKKFEIYTKIWRFDRKRVYRSKIVFDLIFINYNTGTEFKYNFEVCQRVNEIGMFDSHQNTIKNHVVFLFYLIWFYLTQDDY